MIELAKGTNLIEASAGTGKTYTLVRIALRLTLEKGIPLDRILAVTFTEAATEELSKRIRGLYQSCLHQLETNSLDEECLRQAIETEVVTPSEAKRRLRYSLEVFDEAPISALQGFCRRALEIVALETQTPLDPSLENVDHELIAQLQSEYLRLKVFERSEILSLFVTASSTFAAQLASLGKESSAHPYARLRPDPRPYPVESLDEAFRALPTQLGDLLDSIKPHLDKLKKTTRIQKLLSGSNPALFAIVSRGFLVCADVKETTQTKSQLGELTPDAWTSALKKAHQTLPPPTELNAIAERLKEVDAAMRSVLLGYRDWLSDNLRAAKERRNVISFNDLIHSLNGALKGPKGESVATAIANRFDAALIDEFQDTDPVQFQIAQQLFGSNEHYLFFIGDPKQAIYRFRGADIFAYFQATRATNVRRHVLDKNYRSHPKLVSAINALFSASEEGFVFDQIEFAPVKAGRSINDFDDSHVPALQLRSIEQESESIPRNKTAIKRLLARRAAEDLVRRLNSENRRRAKDFSFLVNTRAEADLLNEELSRRNLSAVIRAERSIFQTPECREIRQLLECLAAPSRVALKRGLLLTSLCGFNWDQLLQEDAEEQLDSIFDHLHQWAKDWQTTNFDLALETLLEKAQSLPALLRSPDGERRYTNLKHLAELLEAERAENDLTPQGILNWLHRKTDADVSREEEWQTRLASDEGKPTIITVHKSKGLQFPVVILPFLTHLGVFRNDRYLIYHDERSTNKELIIDLSTEQEEPAKQRAYREELAERIRMLYVAFTRAEVEALAYLAPESNVKSARPSAFAQMLLGAEIADESNKRMPAEIDAQLIAALESLSRSQPDSIALSNSSDTDLGPSEYSSDIPDPSIELKTRSFTRSSNMRHRRILSFSAISRQLGGDEVADDETQTDEPLSSGEETEEPQEEAIPPRRSIFSLPKGIKAGDLFHLILERIDFANARSIEKETAVAFEELQFRPREHQDVVYRQMLLLSQITLNSERDSFRLADIAPRDRIAELEFAYPVFGDVRRRLSRSLESAKLGKIPSSWLKRFQSDASPIDAGMLRGFIDLVFEREGRLYIVDWKSNYLGDRASDYAETKMIQAMADHDYFLQYLLYSIALKRFIETRFPSDSFDERFGGVFYLFVRGLEPDSSNGIFYDRPASQLIDAIDGALLQPA